MPERPKEKVLVVDDDPAVLRVASKVLERAGYEVFEANSGSEAMEIMESRNGDIDLLLTDVVMPGMSGRQLGELARTRFPDVRILYMSAYTEDEVILQGVRVAEVDFISKPFTVEGLRGKVREILDRTAT
ncbi:MAG: response regulator [Gemmatimonadota bacterium]